MAKFSIFIRICASEMFAFVKIYMVSISVHFIVSKFDFRGENAVNKYWTRDHDINAEIFMRLYTNIALDFEMNHKWNGYLDG